LGISRTTSSTSTERRRRDSADFRQDVLAALGEDITVYTTKADGGLMTGWTMAVEVTDNETLTQTIDKIIDLVQSDEVIINTHDFEGK